MSDVKVITWGFCYLSVCSDETEQAEIERMANEVHPTGIKTQWRLSPDPTFKTGQTNPCPCEQTSGRKHYLLSC